jgi:pimeloyl-ACP methyl ester carboxylesterase
MLIQDLTFTVATTCACGYTVLRDRLLGRIGRGIPEALPDMRASRHRIQSGKNSLDAVFVAPSTLQVRAAVLICHGIGEIVDHWVPAQQLLAANGVASLVFDYSGYGKSSGFVSAAQFEEDAVNAFRLLQGLVPSSLVSILGFSMGSGVAAAMLGRVAADRLVLCAAFTSFRNAAGSLGFPKALCALVPSIWRTGETLRDPSVCSVHPVPVLLVHGERDEVFPLQMATDLHGCCGGDAELIVVPNLSHNEPFYRPQISYWGPIVEWLAKPLPGSTGGVVIDPSEAAVCSDASAIHLN